MLKEILKLYLITNRNKQISDIEFLDLIEQAILGGVTSVQLREKNLEYEKFLKLAAQCKEITAKYNIPLFINDNIDIAKKVSLNAYSDFQKFTWENLKEKYYNLFI